jgi:hypothetical protein
MDKRGVAKVPLNRATAAAAATAITAADDFTISVYPRCVISPNFNASMLLLLCPMCFAS